VQDEALLEKNVHLHLTPELVAEMEAAAKAENKTPDQWAGEAIAKYLEDREWRELLTYGQEQVAAGYVEATSSGRN
jgi:predicted transcriptional regulator